MLEDAQHEVHFRFKQSTIDGLSNNFTSCKGTRLAGEEEKEEERRLTILNLTVSA